jgi:hypothetical protein
MSKSCGDHSLESAKAMGAPGCFVVSARPDSLPSVAAFDSWAQRVNVGCYGKHPGTKHSE